MSEFFHLTFEQLPTGTIRLKQDAFDEASVIDLHPWQLRAVVEHFGLVHPVPPADTLTKKLAEQLCRVYLAMCDDYRHLSHVLEEEYARLDVFIDLMPEDVFPGHLWDEREEHERAAAEARANRQAKGHDVAAPAEGDGADAAHGEQLGLPV